MIQNIKRSIFLRFNIHFQKMISYQVRMQCNNLRVSLFSLQSRWLSSTSINDLMTVVQLSRSGGISEKQMSIENILQIVPKKIPLRDLRMLVRHSSSNVKKIPSLLPRPSSSCYILDIEHIRILCFPDKVLWLFMSEWKLRFFHCHCK